MRRRTSKRQSCRRAGFNLADVTITVLIVGILAAVAVPKFVETLKRSQADAAATRIKADLAMARQRALVTSASLTVQFSPSTNDYVIPGLPDLNHSSENYAADVSAYPYNAELVSAVLGIDSDVQFDRYGQPDSGGTITVQSGEYTQTVTVDSETGRATIP